MNDCTEEGKAIATDTIACLTNQDDCQNLELTSQIWQQIEAHRQSQEQKIKQDIKGLLALKEERESELVDEESNAEYQRERAEIKSQIDQVSTQKAGVEQELKSVQEAVQTREEEKGGLKLLKAKVTEETTEVLPQTRYNISLYKNISKICWEYDSPPEEITGYVSTAKDVRPFSLDTRQNSAFFITNYLWDLIEMAN
ncbi:kinetochore protein spc24-like [Anneissia japonica]|uniref:kinetochore protein spc24-like n=1 Tax=Anneissia japonica TaxID=1529436 RepID=UPI0014258E2A|nr:kinetochore protein spc24-like [Anneissia japonica]